jgi:phosphohistidine phosphatase SixA
MIDYRTPPLGYLVRVPQESVDSPLDASARARAEEAARFLSYQMFGRVISSRDIAALETAEIIDLARGTGERMEWDDEYPVTAEIAVLYLKHDDCCVLICTGQEISAIIERLTGANVCGEIVAPGGIISIHREEEKIVVRARHMVLDFKFTDSVEAVTSKETSPA